MELKAHFFFGFSRWKRGFIRPFFPSEERRFCFCRSLSHALERGLSPQSGAVYIWGKKSFDDVAVYAKKHAIPLYRVEDGFIRSVSLGSDLTRAYSLVVDSRGIYFDPTQPSDLEHILNTEKFDETMLARARKLRRYLVEKRLSKYNANPDKKIDFPKKRTRQRTILVPGQVEDDASVIFGADGMRNIELLEAVRQNAPDAYIVYKPHPDVVAGNRKGDIPRHEAMRFADAVITDVSIDSVLEHCDEVHTMTSLVGFEALMRDKKVYTYGLPFYAGWGLTYDSRGCARRKRKRTLDELVAATLIRYPRYIDPVTHRLCEVEQTIANIEVMKRRYNTRRLYRLGIDIRNAVSRKIQLIGKVILGE